MKPQKMKKIKQFDLDFIHDSGDYKLEGCKKFPTLEQFGEAIENLESLGCGKLKKIVIDNVVFEL